MMQQKVPEEFVDQGVDDAFANDIFDPFGLGSNAFQTNRLSEETSSLGSGPPLPPAVNRLTRSTDNLNMVTGRVSSPSQTSSKSIALPPKITVKFTIHEEVSSTALLGVDSEGASEVNVEGKLYAQIQSSDALKNVPFSLVGSTLKGLRIHFRPNPDWVHEPLKTMQSIPSNTLHIVNIPKIEIGSVPLGSYSFTEQVRHMPLLVERKVTLSQSVARIAVQVRSKLTNKGDMQNFTIVVALPERVDVQSVQVVRGNGIVDELKRTIKWTIPELSTGESFMISSQANLWTAVSNEEYSNLHFPIMLRCTSSFDQISSVEFRASEADDFPATVSFSRNHSFRLIHRLS